MAARISEDELDALTYALYLNRRQASRAAYAEALQSVKWTPDSRRQQGQTTAEDVQWRSRHTLGAYRRYECEKLNDLPALELRAGGLSWNAIAAKLGCHRTTAYRRVMRALRDYSIREQRDYQRYLAKQKRRRAVRTP